MAFVGFRKTLDIGMFEYGDTGEAPQFENKGAKKDSP
jgi:hypothetical protein